MSDVDIFRRLRALESEVGRLKALEQTRPMGARVYNDANISIPNGIQTLLTFNAERFDIGGFHSTSADTERLTAPYDGYYLIGATVFWASAAGGRRATEILIGTTPIAIVEDAGVASGATVPRQTVTTLYALTAGEYAQVRVFQDSTGGGALNITVGANYSPEFWIWRVR